MQILEIHYIEGVVILNKFATGLIAGGILGAAGAAVALADRRQKRYVIKGGKKALKRAGHLMENVTDIF